MNELLFVPEPSPVPLALIDGAIVEFVEAIPEAPPIDGAA
jgi:hypothetical protein